MYDIKDVIDFYRTKGSFDIKKMHYLLYYAYITSLLNNESDTDTQIRLFDCHINIAYNGFKIVEFYDLYKNNYFDDKKVEARDGYEWYITKVDKTNKTVFDSTTLEDLESVWQWYGKYDWWQLESLCCNNSPWKELREAANLPTPVSYCPDNVSDQQLFDYYVSICDRYDSTLDLTQKAEDLLYQINSQLFVIMNTLCEYNKEKYQQCVDKIFEAVKLLGYREENLC